jgi:hypothetical protein
MQQPLWQELQVQSVSIPEETLPFLEALRHIYTNGGAELRGFALEPHPLWLAHAAYDDLDRLGFPRDFLCLPSVLEALPEPQRIPDPSFVPSFYRLDEPLEDHLALRLISGGAYVACDQSPEEAEDAALAFCTALLPGAPEEYTTYLCEEGWHGWLHDIAWDTTLVVVNRMRGLVWVLMLTDMD